MIEPNKGDNGAPLSNLHVRKIAAIDIGSNAVRLLIARLKDDGKTFKKELLIRIPLRLGEDSFESGKIGSHRAVMLLQTMKTFSRLMELYHVDVYRACATSAMRDADNGEEIIHLIRQKTALNVRLISGAEEARLIFESHAADRLQTGKNYLYADVGGGSTELSLIVCGALADTRSFNIGTVRQLHGKVALEEQVEMQKYLSEIKTNFAPAEIIGIGGNIHKLCRLSESSKKETLSVNQLTKLYREMAPLSIEERMEAYDLNSDRADVIVPACDIFLNMARYAGVTNYFVPTVGLVDGIVQAIIEKLEKVRHEKTTTAHRETDWEKPDVYEKSGDDDFCTERFDLDDEDSDDD
jgi:exopolyphosphatase / guanosine-5'-triphosphate,3'-diphosphate pyrophosphatase